MAILDWESILKERTAKLLVDALEKALEAAHLSAKEVIEALIGIQAPEYNKLVRNGYLGYYKQLLKKQPEPDPIGLAQTLAAFSALQSAPQNVRALLKQRLKELPHAPGGPPRKVKPEEEKTVCAEIQALLVEYGTRVAIRQVARKRNASERTIYRIWGKYHPKKKRTSPASSH